jgi:uncharacterized protein
MTTISPVKVWRNQPYIKHMLGKKGTIVTFTVIRVPPSGFEGQAPYPVVLVHLDKTGTAIGQLVDYDKQHLKIGQKVVSVFRRIEQPDEEGVIQYGVKFKPL